MSNTHSFARTDMLPPKAPPVTERGVVKWLRENLFSGWFNTILTLVGLYIIGSLAAAGLPRLLNSVWNASSLGECREIAGPAGGACWAVVGVGTVVRCYSGHHAIAVLEMMCTATGTVTPG
jgi:general L-amino acid transport system permease protein